MLRRKVTEKSNEITLISYPQSKLISCRFAVSSQTIFERYGRHVAPARTIWMAPPVIRPARVDEYDEIARVWMDSWVSTGLEHARDSLLAQLRARIPLEVEKGWSLFFVDDGGGPRAVQRAPPPQ